MASLHDGAVVVDCHNDLILTVDRRAARGQPDFFETYWLPNLRAGGVDVQVVPVYSGDQPPGAAMRRILLLIERVYEIVERNAADVALCMTAAEIDAAVGAGKIAFVLALEGCDSVGTDLPLLRTLHRLGVRMVSFTHLGRNLLADGSADDSAGSRLTPAAVDAIGLLEELKIVFDLSHLGAAGVDHALEVATRPLIASHSSAHAVCEHHRNLTDERLKRIAATGGVVGVNLITGFIDPTAPTIDRVVDHIEHIAGVAGIDHVGIGPDFIKEWADDEYAAYPDLEMAGVKLAVTIEGLATSRDLPNLTDALVRRGFDDDSVRKVLGENFLRVFREIWN